MLKFMKIAVFVGTVAALSACTKNEASEQKKAEAPMEQMNKESSKAVTAQAVGVITAIDKKGNILTLEHEAIPAIKWPAMTMGFKVADPALLEGLTIGQHVEFELKAEGENYIIVAVKPKTA
ncbi:MULTISPECIES: copper-binding protein [Acinetobacter]|jgi:Cu(I)/Ag(I) efflux system protein CusF|uniref:copper-binding protein n=1 Tax=Acinetobacter TaxID=469 RepID=UPI00044E41BF|nr:MULTISPECIES: copper-binding protein [Acinetobacter]MDQ9825301.1 copper-binding protein [Acinetobacter sp. 163]AZC08516.1 copper-binding protein [Acinetobacter nosocomialis]EHU1210664.1 copper-binding protein [Acinetobacter nosocomialis]EXH10789.1 copper binding periplasmic CusF family protein [Acinetobacter sp. 1245593]EXR26461.1 copper binding periplasmic CusF family protein [Acinetobacter sp. 1281984]